MFHVDNCREWALASELEHSNMLNQKFHLIAPKIYFFVDSFL